MCQDVERLFSQDQIITRAEAKRIGLKAYFTGKPCKYGHIDTRLTVNGDCRVCNQEKLKRYVATPTGREKRREGSRKRVGTPETIAYWRRYRERNKENIVEYFRNYRANNRAKLNELKKKWIKNNPSKFVANINNRRARKISAEGNFSSSDVENIRKLQKDKCAVCGIKLNNRGSVDHIIPISKGGSNWPFNLQLLCRSCNSSKGAKQPEEFMRTRGYLL